MGLIQFFKKTFQSKNKEPSVNTIITLPNNENTTISYLIHAHGQYTEIQQTNKVLRQHNTELIEENAVLRQENATLKRKTTPKLTKTDIKVLKVIQENKITPENMVKEIINNGAVKSRASVYRIIKKLEEEQKITLKNNTYKIS